MLNGAQLAADEANEAGGIMGMQIDVVPADDEADPETGKLVAQRMVDEGVFAVIARTTPLSASRTFRPIRTRGS